MKVVLETAASSEVKHKLVKHGGRKDLEPSETQNCCPTTALPSSAVLSWGDCHGCLPLVQPVWSHPQSVSNERVVHYQNPNET